MIREGKRTCPNCGVQESRWTKGGRDHVNLSPITGQCVDCLIAMTKEFRQTQRDFGFDAKATAARNDA